MLLPFLPNAPSVSFPWALEAKKYYEVIPLLTETEIKVQYLLLICKSWPLFGRFDLINLFPASQKLQFLLSVWFWWENTDLQSFRTKYPASLIYLI